jgi:hypothetical protein
LAIAQKKLAYGMTDLIARPKLGVLSQGTIFNCASAEDYHGCNVRGLVITARCDISQSKAPIYNYLPVVSLDDWIHRDGRAILCDKLLKNVNGKLRSCLRNAGYSDTILLTQEPANILATLFSDQETKAKAKSRDQFRQLAEDRAFILECMASNADVCLVVRLADQFTSDRDALLKELTQQRLNGYYFLPSIIPDQEAPGHVVLLRQVQHIPRDLAARIGSGLSEEIYALDCKERAEFSDRLSYAVEKFAMPIGALSSPHVEHLMQVFSTLFVRIGLPDLDSTYLDSIWGNQPSVGRSRNEVRGI